MDQPQQLRALSMDEDIYEWLAKQQVCAHPSDYILNVYKNVINCISYDKKQFFSIGSQHVIRNPYMLNIEQKIDFRSLKQNKNPIKQISVEGNKLIVANTFEVDFEKAERWDASIIRFSSYKADFLLQALWELVCSINEKGKAGGLRAIWLHHHHLQDSYSLSIHERNLAESFQKLADLIDSNDERKKYDACKNLVGLGVGLTPSGDDFLAGMILTLQAFQHPYFSFFKNLQQDWLEFVKVRTTTVSYFMLEAALKGKGNEAIQALIIGIGIKKTTIKPVIDRVLSIGSCSGTDMLVGVSFALEMILKQHGREKNGL